MLQNFVSDLRLYQRLIALQIRAQLQYKINLTFEIISTLGVMCLEFVALLLFFIPFPTLMGWKVGEVALQAAIIAIGFGLADMVGSGLDEFSWLVRRGEFDRVLLRPAGALIQVMGYEFLLRRLGRIIQGLLALGVALALLPNLHWTPDKVLVLLLGVVSGIIVFVSILLIGATICFWSVETTEITNLLFFGGREMLSYPLDIYHQFMQRFFLFVVPIAFSSYVPACYILGKPLPFGLPPALAFFSPLAALFFALVARVLWGFGIRHYESTGS
jgi:ABC-2 type transport system permease protein